MHGAGPTSPRERRGHGRQALQGSYLGRLRAVDVWVVRMSEMKPSEAIRACLAWFTSDGDAEYPVEALRAALPQVEAMERDNARLRAELEKAAGQLEGR